MQKSVAFVLLAALLGAAIHPTCAFVSTLVPSSRSATTQRSTCVYATTSPSSTTASTTSSTVQTTTSTTTNSTLAQLEHDVILYDGVCNFCNTFVDLLLRIDSEQKLRFAPLQSRIGQELLLAMGKQADDISSVVLVKAKTGESYDKSRCVLKVVEELGPVAALASQVALRVVPENIRDSIYDTVAENRYNFMGKRDECRCSDPQFADRFLLD